MGYSEVQEKLIHEKKQKLKISCMSDFFFKMNRSYTGTVYSKLRVLQNLFFCFLQYVFVQAVYQAIIENIYKNLS